MQFYYQLLARVSSLPGVQSASAGWPLPMSPGAVTITFNIQGRPVARGEEPGEVMSLVMPGFFETMRIPLLAGRTLDQRDDQRATPVIIISQAFARKYFPGQNPLGQHIQVRMGDDVLDQPIRQVVGVVGNIKLRGLTADLLPQYYLPLAQTLVTNPFLVVRTTGDPAHMEGAIRAAVHSLNESTPVYQVSTLEDYVSSSAAQPRFQMFVLTCFATIALILAAIGLYGLLSYMVAQRTLETGLRMALGGQRSDVLGMIIRQGIRFAVVGIGLGIAASIAVTRLLSGMLYGVRPSDPATFVATTCLLLLVSLAATVVPAWRAANLDPNQTLREQ
jgi:putative ABC transport system permease protein